MGLEEFDIKKIGIVLLVLIVLLIGVWFFVLAPKPEDTKVDTKLPKQDNNVGIATSGPPDYNKLLQPGSETSATGIIEGPSVDVIPEDKPIPSIVIESLNKDKIIVDENAGVGGVTFDELLKKCPKFSELSCPEGEYASIGQCKCMPDSIGE